MSEDFPAHLAGFKRGSLVAGYRLEAQIGAGGMAVVFRARDERLGRLVALKLLAPVLAADQGFRRRFIAESRSAAAVDDPHIIPVYEAGEADGVLFIAMRFVKGGDLRLILEREGALPPDRAAAFISAVASALDAAHRAGLVHRDVKPANMLVDRRPGQPDHVYLSDFGVSKGALSSVSLTETGHFLGTAGYAAPEQIQGLAVDGRTDQYALACVAYQLLTGTVPFARDQGMAVLFAHMSQPPPSLGPGFPDAADEVVARALAKVPEQRYRSCGDFADALREALGLIPDTSLSSAPVPGHPQPHMAEQPEFSRSAVPAGAGTAEPSAGATMDPLPASGAVGAATVPPAAVIIPGSGYGAAQEGIPGVDPEAKAASQLAGKSQMAGESGGLTTGPVRSTADSDRLSDVESALTAVPAPATRSKNRRSHREQPRRSWRSGHRRGRIVTAALVVLVALVIGGGYIFWRFSQSQYYVAANSSGQVVVYRGVKYSTLGISWFSPYQLTGIQLDQVPQNYQQTVKAADSSGSLAQMHQTVANIATAVDECRSQYAAQEAWVTSENAYAAYQARAAAARRAHLTANLGPPPPNPGPRPLAAGQQPSGTGGTCPPPEAFGIPASALTPAPPGSS